MRGTNLLNIIFSLVLVTGVSTGAALAQTDHVEEKLENYCSLTDEQKHEFFLVYPDLAEYKERLAEICEIDDEEEREDAIEQLLEYEVEDDKDNKNKEHNMDDDSDETSEEMKDEEHEQTNDKKNSRHDMDDKNSDLDDLLEMYCEMNVEEKERLLSSYPRVADFQDKLESFCGLSADERENEIDKLIEEQFEYDTNQVKEQDNLDDIIEHFCEISETQKDEFFSDHPRLAQFEERLSELCEISDVDEREDKIENFVDELLSKYDFKSAHQTLVRELQDDHDDIQEHKMEYDKFCKMTDEERNTSIDDPEKLEAISDWCEMTPEERKISQKAHHDAAMDFKEEHLSSVERMKENKDLSHRLKMMIMDTPKISDDKLDEIKAKYKETYGKDAEKHKMELKMKLHDRESEIKSRLSTFTDEQRDDILQRYKEMKDFKSQLQQNSDLTDIEKQELRAQFIENAKDIQLAWITPRDQVSAGIEPDLVECREGYSLVMKNSNGLPMCVKSNTAIKMIEKGIAIPAN